MILQMYNAIGDNEVVNIEETTFQVNEFGNLIPIALMGTINSSSLTVTISTSEILKKGTREIGACMYTAVWEWAANKPLIKYKDPISVNWDSNVFLMNSFYSQDTGRNSQSVDCTIVRDYGNPAESAQGGVGFFNNLPLNYTYIGGGLILLLQPTYAMYQGTLQHTQISFNYYHNRNPLGFGVSIGYEGSGITINPGSLYDSIAISKPFDFSRS